MTRTAEFTNTNFSRHEFQAGRMLSIGAWGALLLGALTNVFSFQALLAVPAWISGTLSAGVTLSEFVVFRAMLAVTAASPREPSRIVSKIAAGASAFSLFLITGAAVVRSVPHPSASLLSTVFALLSFVLPLSAAAISAAAQPLLWSHRLVAIAEKKKRELQRWEYEMAMLAAFERELKKPESEPRASAVPTNT